MDIDEKVLNELLAKANEPIQRLDIGGGHYIEHDLPDGWFVICDEDWFGYDRGGACSFSVEEIDDLIKALLFLKKSLESSSNNAPPPAP